MHNRRGLYPIVVKLGGSLITIKDKPYTINRSALQRVASILGEYYRRAGGLVVVHGGGSYGHYAVREASERRGLLGSIDVAAVQKVMIELSINVANALLGEGIPVTIYPGHALCRRNAECFFWHIRGDLENGLVPMTYGDALFDDKGSYIISGDDLSLWLASAFNSKKIIFVMDKEGILDEHGNVIPRIKSLDDLGELTAHEFDVTGGLTRKIELILDYAREHPDTEIWVTGLEGLEDILIRGIAPLGTLVKP